VQAFARSLYQRGKLETLSYGNIGAADVVAVARRVSSALRLTAVPDKNLLRRRLLVQRAGQTVRTSEALLVNNSAFRREVMLGGDNPQLRAATLALASFVGPLIYNELRTQQQLGYIVFGGAGNEGRSQFAYFIIQSGDYPADELETRADKVIGELPARLQALDEAQWQTIVAGVRAKLEEKDKSIGERSRRLFELAYEFDGDWARQEATVDALSGLTRQTTAALLASALRKDSARNRVFLGFARDLRPRTPPVVSFSDPGAWKAGQRYE
jgi:insulysin